MLILKLTVPFKLKISNISDFWVKNAVQTKIHARDWNLTDKKMDKLFPIDVSVLVTETTAISRFISKKRRRFMDGLV